MSIHDLLAWWNLVYVVPFLLAILYLGVHSALGLSFADHDVDGDAVSDAVPSHDVEADADHEAVAEHDLDGDADADHDVEGDADADHDADHDAAEEAGSPHAHPPAHSGEGESSGEARDSHSGSVFRPLAFLGVGLAPISILATLLSLSWGMAGLVANQILAAVWPASGLLLLGSVPVAAIGSCLFTRTSARLLARWMPSSESYAVPLARLAGRSGVALFDVNDRFGMALVRDSRGDRFQVPCRTYQGRPSVRKGAKVLLVEYAPQTHGFFVTEDDMEP
jgi:hypothetical protein